MNQRKNPLSTPVTSKEGHPPFKQRTIQTNQPGMWLTKSRGLIALTTMDSDHLQRAYWYAERQYLFHHNHPNNPRAAEYEALFRSKLLEIEQEARIRELELASLDEQTPLDEFLSNDRIGRFKYGTGMFLTPTDFRRPLLWRGFAELDDAKKAYLRPYKSVIDADVLLQELTR